MGNMPSNLAASTPTWKPFQVPPATPRAALISRTPPKAAPAPLSRISWRGLWAQLPIFSWATRYAMFTPTMSRLFFQDDYRMTPKITVNLGVRYELGTVWVDANNRLGNFDPNSPNGFVQVANGISSPYNGDHHDWSPRLGIAWDISGNQKTVVRAGASLLYEFVPSSAFLNSGGNSAGLGKVPTGAEICVNAKPCVPGNGTIAAAVRQPRSS